MNTDIIQANPTRRLSLDLPTFTHDELEELATILGFSSKTETVKSALLDFHGKMSAVLDGHQIMMRDKKTGELRPLYGDPLEHLYRRVQQMRASSASKNIDYSI